MNFHDIITNTFPNQSKNKARYNMINYQPASDTELLVQHVPKNDARPAHLCSSHSDCLRRVLDQ
jgi:hypothetical protein